MDSGAPTVHLNQCQMPSCKSSAKNEELCVNKVNIQVVEQPVVVEGEGRGSLGPKTPIVSRDNGCDCNSPLTVVNKMPNISSDDSLCKITTDVSLLIDQSSPRTPKESVFDPFAPGPEDKVLAPICNKYADAMRISVARCLSFDSLLQVRKDLSRPFDVESLSDEEMFESVYENLLEAIVSTQTEAALAEISIVNLDADTCNTPLHSTPLSGIADTCPGAPLKLAGKSRKIDLGLCKKLEF
ncbi:cyclin-dependent protein kinase inhibitor SMR11-like [Carica papaya]|uniref:cyclin-dependent protein kinase inhibitor SMR11-like n=1 Tax=Carica papaya TaxID=3649 RepID=UPI000B8C7D0E|nr:cyclin-dependent protein kinase inhibitor SMR11-like [Carica papaya]